MWTSAIVAACAAVVIAAAQPALAQRSLFEQPVPQESSPTTPVQAQPPATSAPAAETPKPKPRPKVRRPKGPVPARSLSVNNASPNVLTALEVSGDGKSARMSKPLAPTKKATLKLPAFKSCTVTVAASFEGQAAGESSELDICKEKSIRFTE